MKYYAKIYNKYNNVKLIKERTTEEKAIKTAKFFCKNIGDWAVVYDENDVRIAIIETIQTTITI